MNALPEEIQNIPSQRPGVQGMSGCSLFLLIVGAIVVAAIIISLGI